MANLVGMRLNARNVYIVSISREKIQRDKIYPMTGLYSIDCPAILTKDKFTLEGLFPMRGDKKDPWAEDERSTDPIAVS